MKSILAKSGKRQICQCMSSHFGGVESRSALANLQKSVFCQCLNQEYCLKMTADTFVLAKYVYGTALIYWQIRSKCKNASVKPQNGILKWGYIHWQIRQKCHNASVNRNSIPSFQEVKLPQTAPKNTKKRTNAVVALRCSPFIFLGVGGNLFTFCRRPGRPGIGRPGRRD